MNLGGFYHGTNVGAVLIHPGPLPRGAVCYSYTQFTDLTLLISFREICFELSRTCKDLSSPTISAVILSREETKD
jgi:hypothetical protein